MAVNSFVNLKNVYLNYPIFGADQRSIKNEFFGSIVGGVIEKNSGNIYVEALRDISLTAKAGDRIGLIGGNGAGKSTLLKVLASVYKPNKGLVEINGRVVSALNPTLGMEMEATGEENIITRSMLFGFSKKEAKIIVDEVAEFSGLGDYLKFPVRTYSSGMITRLAFSVTTSVNADILLMDEIIATGDSEFLERAEKRLENFLSKISVIFLASHSNEIINRFCNLCVYLDKGKVKAWGPTEKVLNEYFQNGL